MLDNLDKIKQNIKKRNLDIHLEHLQSLAAKRSSLIQKIQTLRKERNKISRQDTKENRKRGKEIKEELKIIEPQLFTLEQEFNDLLLSLPNDICPDSPLGTNEEENVVIRQHGEKPNFSFKPLDHLTLMTRLDLIDFERGAKTSGSSFYFLKKQGVILEFALIKFALDFLSSKGFLLLSTPELAKEEILKGTGFQPRGKESQIYNLEDSDLSLIGTSEITVAGYHQNETIKNNQLPLKYAGFSHCFRKEAGSYGRESRGLFRIHQFPKVEMFIFSLPHTSDKMLAYLLSLEEEIYQELEIPYRVVDICAGQLGNPAYRKYDLEAYLPGLNKWGEITSVSNCTDYQAKRLHIKYQKEDGTTDYLHTLNGTAIATPRILIAIMENFQQKDGSVIIPKKLHQYTGFQQIKS